MKHPTTTRSLPTPASALAWLALLVTAVSFASAPGESRARGETRADSEARREEEARSDREAILGGVERIAAPGVPGPLAVTGEEATCLVAARSTDGLWRPAVAAARWEDGRVVIFGHPSYLDAGAPMISDTGRLLRQAARWAAGGVKPTGRAGPRGKRVRVGVAPGVGIGGYLSRHGVRVRRQDLPAWPEDLDDLDVIIARPEAWCEAEAEDQVRQFVTRGGGLISADLGWGWLQLHPGKSLAGDHAGNRLLAPCGLAWADGTFGKEPEGGFATRTPPPLSHALRALEALEAAARPGRSLPKEERRQASAVLSDAAGAVSARERFLLPRLEKLRSDPATRRLPAPDRPLGSDQPLARVLLTLELHRLASTNPEAVRAHPAATAFPGAVPRSAERVRREVAIDTAIPGWHSTGLYAPPGEVIELSREGSEPSGRGLFLRIGCHTDRLWHLARWRRAPEIALRVAIDAPRVRVASAFGGLLYVEVARRGGTAATVRATISGAVEAPWFELGRTSTARWRDSIRRRLAPWAELGTRKVILTVPSSVVRELDDPEPLLELWNRVLDTCAWLAARPLERERPERYVTDVQISAGYMHAGYPIMTGLDIAPVLVDRRRIAANDHGGIWGLFHELGHNHQSRDWTFAGTGEVTENLFSLLVWERVCDRSRPAHSELSPRARRRRTAKYIAAGADFEAWKRDPFLGFELYYELREAFGWETYRKVFAEYRALPRSERPRTDAEKRDQWLVRFSRAAGKDLGPFLAAWGIPLSARARSEVAELPDWLPEGFPPRDAGGAK